MSGERWMADINGDSRADFVRLMAQPFGAQHRLTVQVALTGVNGLAGELDAVEVTLGFGNGHWAIDLNGDGCADFVRFMRNEGQISIGRSFGGAKGILSETVLPGQGSPPFRDRRSNFWVLWGGNSTAEYWNVEATHWAERNSWLSVQGRRFLVESGMYEVLWNWALDE